MGRGTFRKRIKRFCIILLLLAEVLFKGKMTENKNKKKRIALVGNMTNTLGTINPHCDDELAQADCDLVYNIMQSMEKSQNEMSYQQLQENRVKEKVISRTNDSNLNSSRKRKYNKSLSNSRQLKKIIPEKSFPLMAKCQKSMKYLKKNRCIPKPRAHVGSLRRLSPVPTSNFKSNYNCDNNSISSNTVNIKKRSMNTKQYSKKNEYSDLNAKQKKENPKSFGGSCDDDTFQTEGVGKKLKVNIDTDSDNEFEKFLQKHHPEKCTASYKDAPAARRKIKNTNKTKKKRNNKKLKCDTKISEVTSEKLSDFERTSEMECNENNHEVDQIENSCSRRFPSKKFRRIVDHTNSDDSSSDTYLNDSVMLNNGSFSSSEDENSFKKSSDKESVRNAIDLDDSGRLDVLPSVSNSTAFLELINTSNSKTVKLKCLKPCSVLLKRDPALDQKAALLQTDSSSVRNMVPLSNLYDDDCFIISETSINDPISQDSQNIRQSVEHKNSQRKAAVLSESSVSEVLTGLDDMQDRYTCSGKLKDSSCNLRTQTETSSLISNQKSTKNLFEYKSMEVLTDEKAPISVDTTNKSLPETAKDESSTVNKETRSSNKNINSIDPEEKGATTIKSLSRHTSELSKDETRVSLNCDGPTSTEKEIFNVQILSVKSLNESDIIILSDDDEEKDSKTVPNINVTNENVTEDSDVEIICLDSIVVDKKASVNENARDALKNEIHNKVDNSIKENSSNSAAQPMVLDEEDCIILDDVDLSIEKHTSKNADKMQPNSQANVISDDIIKTRKENSNKSGEIISDKVDTGNTILKILETIDFNCIKKVLNETTITDTQKAKNSENISIKAEATLCDDNRTSVEDRTVDSFPKIQEPSQSETTFSEKRTLIDVNVMPVGCSEVNINIRNLETSPVDKREHKFIEKSNVPHTIIKNDSENMGVSVKSKISSISDCDTSSTFLNSNTDLIVPKLPICETIIASNNKTKQDVLILSRKNQQMLPMYPKMESYESPCDELDIIAAKSIQNLGEHEKKTILPLLELYRTEYKKFMQIRCTGQNVTDGLKLLEESQAKKLMVISSSIKNFVKNDGCFHKVNNEFRNNQTEHKDFIKSSLIKKAGTLDEKKPFENIKPHSSGNNCDIEKEDKVKIFHPSIVEKASEVIKSKTVGPSSSREVYNHLINSVCADCGQHAKFACLGCAKIYYCSEKCGMSHWSKGHYATCRR